MDQVARLRQSINDSGLSFAELERITKIPKSTIQRYAAGTTKKIPMDAIEAIARAVNVSAAYIMGWEDDPPATHCAPVSDIRLTDLEHEIIRSFRSADSLDQELVLRILKIDSAVRKNSSAG